MPYTGMQLNSCSWKCLSNVKTLGIFKSRMAEKLTQSTRLSFFLPAESITLTDEECTA